MFRHVILLCCLVAPAIVWSREISSFIVGGIMAEQGSWPWMMSLFRSSTFICGASLLGPKYALTAAHCVADSILSYRLFYGSIDRTCCDSRTAQNITRYPDFVDSGALGYPNDIAVVAWNIRIIQEPAKAEYIPMATSADDLLGQTCYITGWGLTSVPGETVQFLHQGQVELITNAQCQAAYPGTPINSTQICAQDTANNSVAACDGDLGGPLVCRTSPTDDWTLNGIISWGSGGCQPQYPTVCTRVSQYRDWVLEYEPS